MNKINRYIYLYLKMPYRVGVEQRTFSRKFPESIHARNSMLSRVSVLVC